MPLNVLGEELACCCTNPMTGFHRDGFCRTGQYDTVRIVICAQVTKEFLEFSLSMGNDLITPIPEANFPGLKPGDKWCLCAFRWKEALEADLAPPVYLAGTHVKALDFVTLQQLRENEVKRQ